MSKWYYTSIEYRIPGAPVVGNRNFRVRFSVRRKPGKAFATVTYEAV